MTVGVGDIVRITAKLLLNGVSDIVNVYHFSVAANTTLNDTAFMTEVALELDTLYAGINPVIATTVTYVSLEGQNITKDELLPSRPWPTLIAGASATEQLPEQCSVCVFQTFFEEV